MVGGNKEYINLVSCDGTIFKVNVDHAMMSGTLKDVIDDTGIENNIPLPNISKISLKFVINWIKQHYSKDNDTKLIDNKEWDNIFAKTVSHDDLFNVILAANYLDIQQLLHLGCQTVANQLKGKTRKEILDHFEIKEDFTSEEENQVRKEHNWLDNE